MANKSDDAALRALQVALVDYQVWAIKTGAKALTLFEGRDAAGKDGTIKRIIEHAAPRYTRAVSLPKPSDREVSQWYFQRYIAHLPTAGEWVIFNRSWYNRAGVEPVMGFCTAPEHKIFLRDVTALEPMLASSDIRLTKIWLDISKDEQARRLRERTADPIKRLKISDLDGHAQEKWAQYSAARDEMLLKTHTSAAPWICVRADHKPTAHLNVIRHLLHDLAPPNQRSKTPPPDPDVVFPFDPTALHDGRLAK